MDPLSIFINFCLLLIIVLWALASILTYQLYANTDLNRKELFVRVVFSVPYWFARTLTGDTLEP